MGVTGTERSESAAETMLVDDNFKTIVEAMRKGHAILDNIRKFRCEVDEACSSTLWRTSPN